MKAVSSFARILRGCGTGWGWGVRMGEAHVSDSSTTIASRGWSAATIEHILAGVSAPVGSGGAGGAGAGSTAAGGTARSKACLLYTSPSPRDAHES
eukprot:3986421-Prymnesium_polylepis.1